MLPALYLSIPGMLSQMTVGTGVELAKKDSAEVEC